MGPILLPSCKETVLGHAEPDTPWKVHQMKDPVSVPLYLVIEALKGARKALDTYETMGTTW